MPEHPQIAKDAEREAKLAREARRRRYAKLIVFTLAAVKTILAITLMVGAIGSSGQDKAGQAMASGFFFLAIVYWLVLVLPPVLLARKGRHLGFALALLLLPEPIGMLLFMGL